MNNVEKCICMCFEHFIKQDRRNNKIFLPALFLFGIKHFHSNMNAKNKHTFAFFSVLM